MKRNLLVPVVFLLLIGAACKPQSGSAAADINKSNTIVTDSSDGKAKGELLDVARKFNQARFVTAKLDWVKTVSGKDLAYSQQIEFAAPSKSHTKWFMKVGEPDETEYIGIGKTSYAKTCWKCPDGGKWTKYSESGEVVDPRGPFAESSLRRLADVKFEGDEVVDGNKTNVYTYKNQVFIPIVDGVNAMTASSCKIWIRQDKQTPVKLHADFNDSPVKYLDIVFDVEKPVEIQEPKVEMSGSEKTP